MTIDNLNESTEKINKKVDKVWLLKNAVSDFVNKKMQREDDAVNFYDRVIESNYSITPTIPDDFLKFIKNTEYSIINFSDKETPESLFNDILKKNVISKCIKLETIRKKTKDVFLALYDISDYSFIESKVKKMTTWELSILLNSEIERNKFLKRIYINDKANLPKEKNLLDQIDKLFNINWVNLSEEQIKAVKKLISYRENVTISDINSILNCEPKIFRTIEQKQLLIRAFLPTVNLKQLLDWWIIDKKQMNLAIDAEYKNILDKYWVSEDKIWDNLLIRPDDIIISTFLFPEETVDKLLSSDWLQNIVNEINKLKEEVRKKESILDNLDENNTNNSFIDYLQNDNKIESKEIKENIKKLQKWNYIKISAKDKNWKDKVQFYYINRVDVWSTLECKWVELKNVTNSCWVLDHSSVNPDPIITYQKFYDLLKWIDTSKGLSSIVFYDDINKEEDKIDEKTWEVIEEGKTEFGKEWLAIIKNDDKINTINDLKNILDCVDLNWKQVPINKMAIIAQADKNQKQDEAAFSIKSISNNEVILTNNEKFSFQDFVRVFKDRKCERFERNDNFSDLINWLTKLWDDFKDYWDLIVNNWKIIPESEKDKNNCKPVEFFIWEDWTAARIVKIDDWEIEFIIWEYKESKDKTKKWDTFKSKYKFNSFDDFYFYAKKNNLKPKKDIEIEDEKIEDVSRDSSMLKSWFSMLSIAEIIAWWEQLINSIEQWLEQWNKLKSAKFALKLWKMIPWFDASDLQSTVEAEEKKTMEEIVDWLKTLDSKEMIPKIEKILLNKSSEQYEIEAALMATLKYWTLYPKWQLKKYRWKRLWYQALWGDLNDLKRYKKNILEDDPDVILNEELVLFELLKDQAQWRWKYKRRSKIHKEYNSTLWSWIEKELWDWEKDTWDKMTQWWRIWNVIWEFKNGTYANWVWWIEKIWDKWPTPAHAMNTAPFVLTISWIAKNFPQPLINKIMWMWWTTPYTALTFNNKLENIELYHKTTEEVIKSFDWEKSNMMSAFKKIRSAKEWEAVQVAYDFWLEYGSKINSRLNLADWYIYANKDKNKYFWEYVEWITWVHSDAEFTVKSEDITTWAVSYKTNPLFLTWWKKLFRSNFNFNASGRLPKEWWILLKEVLEELKDIKNLTLSDDKEEDIELKKKLYKQLYSYIEPAIRAWLWVFEWKADDSPEVRMLKREWIDISEFQPNDSDFVWAAKADTVYWYIESERYDKFLDTKWDDYISWKNENTIDWNEENTKVSVLDILWDIEEVNNQKNKKD